MDLVNFCNIWVLDPVAREWILALFLKPDELFSRKTVNPPPGFVRDMVELFHSDNI